MNKHKTFKIIIIIILLVEILSFFGMYKCPSCYIFGIPCITCGMSRAFYSIITLNFKESFYYHALWPLVIIAFIIYTLLEFKIIKIEKKKIINLIIILISIFILYYIIRHIIGSPIVKIDFKNSLIYKLLNI